MKNFCSAVNLSVKTDEPPELDMNILRSVCEKTANSFGYETTSTNLAFNSLILQTDTKCNTDITNQMEKTKTDFVVHLYLLTLTFVGPCIANTFAEYNQEVGPVAQSV